MRHLGWTVTVQQKFYDAKDGVMYGPLRLFEGYRLTALLQIIFNRKGK